MDIQNLKTILNSKWRTISHTKFETLKQKKEVELKETSSGIVVKFDEKVKEYMHKIIAKQFLEFEAGDQINFDDGDKLNYDAWNLNVVKNKEKKKKNDKSIFIDNEYSCNEFREEINNPKQLILAQIKERL